MNAARDCIPAVVLVPPSDSDLQAASDAWEAAVATYERTPNAATKLAAIKARRRLDVALGQVA
jgi:hypothetical protein